MPRCGRTMVLGANEARRLYAAVYLMITSLG